MHRIFIVEDDAAIAAALGTYLARLRLTNRSQLGSAFLPLSVDFR